MIKDTTFFYKLLLIGVIVLFIGVGIQPAFAVYNKSTNIEDVEDFGCEEISYTKIVKIERLLDRIEITNELLLLLSKHNPELIVENEKLSNKIKEFTSNLEVLATNPSNENRPICKILANLGVIVLFSYCFYALICTCILYDVPEGNLLHKMLSFILFIPVIPIQVLLASWIFLYSDVFKCM